MVSFNIRLKANSNGDKMTRYVEINVYGKSFRLLQKQKLSVDGVEKSIPYKTQDDEINIYKNGKNIVFDTNFGLKLRWTGTNTDVDLCQQYAHLVCGLCGRGVFYQADRSKPNEYLVDRQNVMVTSGSSNAEREFNWAAAWRVPDDSSDAPPQ